MSAQTYQAALAEQTVVGFQSFVNFDGEFKMTSRGRVVRLVSDIAVSDRLTITKVIVMKRKKVGKDTWKNQTVRVAFHNLSDTEFKALEVGAFIEFQGELDEASYQDAQGNWHSYNFVASWGLRLIAASRATRLGNEMPNTYEQEQATEPVPVPTMPHSAALVTPAPVTEPTSYDDIPF